MEDLGTQGILCAMKTFYDRYGMEIYPIQLLPKEYTRAKIQEHLPNLRKWNITKALLEKYLSWFIRIEPTIIDRSWWSDLAVLEDQGHEIREETKEILRALENPLSEYDWMLPLCTWSKDTRDLWNDVSLAVWWIFRDEELMKETLENY